MCEAKEICPVCLKLRERTAFFYYIDKHYDKQKECVFCFNSLRKLDNWLAKVLEGVRIPYYETPIIKYKIPSENSVSA